MQGHVGSQPDRSPSGKPCARHIGQNPCSLRKN
jgi:hypothetical protein